ncbi:uncharacterized protein LOC123010199 [Tribolium madens]|uniref:uncharacterized protein LOC123010199 n=1 Tax=Tribolium madens TaxID=41895 RepID=UPI001CF7374A|nr:uncharacterized protein LOC123010199 [Tribolium madens]
MAELPKSAKSEGQVSHRPRTTSDPLHPYRLRPYPITLPPESSPHCAFRPIHPLNNGINRAYYWVDTFTYGGVPSTALWGGEDIDGHQIYVGRAYFKSDWIPAKVIPGRSKAYVAYGGKEYTVDRFQVLCEQRFDWVKTTEDKIPEGAVEGGRTVGGEPLYIGRVEHEGSHTVGKVHPSDKCCSIPFDGKELRFSEYEILILRSSTSTAALSFASCQGYGFKPEFSHSAPLTPPSYPPNQNSFYPPLHPSGYPPQNTSFSHSSPSNNQAFRWVDSSIAYGSVPPTALQGGMDGDGHPIYVGRAYHDGDLIPAKVIPGKNAAYVAHNGEEHLVENFQVLCKQYFEWVQSHAGHLPPGAVQGGHTSEGEPLYIGRAYHEGSQTIGKIHPSHGVCYIPYGGEEIACPEYETLVLRI